MRQCIWVEDVNVTDQCAIPFCTTPRRREIKFVSLEGWLSSSTPKDFGEPIERWLSSSTPKDFGEPVEGWLSSSTPKDFGEPMEGWLSSSAQFPSSTYPADNC